MLIFHNIFKYMIFQRRQKALLWSRGSSTFVMIPKAGWSGSTIITLLWSLNLWNFCVVEIKGALWIFRANLCGYLTLNILIPACWVIFYAFSSSADIFQNRLFRKILSGIPTECQTISDPYQARHFVRPDLGSNFCKSYQKMTLSRRRVKSTNPTCEGILYSVLKIFFIDYWEFGKHKLIDR